MSWTKHRRNGNEEIPSDRSAVKVIRRSSRETADNNSLESPSKQQPTVNKVTKLVYEPKRNVPTTAVLKSIHSYRLPQDHIVEMPSKSSKMSEQNVNQPSVKAPIDEPVTPPYLRIPAVADLRNTFARKSQIQKEAKEIHEMILKGLSYESPKKSEEPKVPFSEAVLPAAVELSEPVPSVSQSPSAVMQTTGSSTRRSKTDPEIANRGRLRVTTNMNQPTSRSARSKSSVNIKSQRTGTERTNSTAKQKSYDSERARQFIQEQRERHRVQNQAIATQKIASKVNRDEIKKRLEDLRKNTMAILKKNIRKVRKRSADPVDRYPLTDKMSAEEEEEPVVNITPAIVSSPSKKAKTIARPTEALNQPAESQRSHVKPPKSPRKALRSSNMDQKQEIPTKLKKIGLLRKPDSEFVVGSLDFCLDKENISLEIPQPRPQSTKPQTPRKESISKNRSPPPKLTTTNTITEPIQIEMPKTLPDLELTVPDVKLKQRPDVADKATQFQPLPPEKSSLPFWLQPTSVQPYPYNFIMAVRKKLEAVTNPIQVTQTNKADIHKKVELTEQPTKFRPPPTLSLPSEARRRLLNRRELNEVSSINIEQTSGHKLSSASSVFTAFLNSPEIFAKPNNNSRQKEPEVPKAPPADRTRSFSDITSSITINIPQSNTASEVSSIQSELGKNAVMTSTRISRKARSLRNSDDTTASSSVFSSPEKRTRSIRPLDRPQIRVNDGPLSPLSIDRINDLNLKSKSEMKTAEDFELMLEDFNRSLSQVIEVNQQLSSVLSKSPQSKSPSKTESSKGVNNTVSSKSDNYSSDFEDAVISDPNDKTGNLVRQNNDKGVEKQAVDETIVANKSEQLAPSTSVVETEIADVTASTVPSQTTVTIDAPSSSTPDPAKISVKNSSSQSISEHLSTISIEENVKNIVGSPDRPKLNASNNFSKDFVELQQVSSELRSPTKPPSFLNCQMIRNHVNTKRGDSFTVTSGTDTFVIDSCETKIVPSDDSISVRPALNTSFGSDIYAIFSQSELELSISPGSRLSETNLSYSTLGLYGQLIQTEETKTEHLTALLKIREKSILDRTKGQIALLEIQKEKCKVKGLTVEISMIRRKQRALLLKMEKEREEIKRFLAKLSEKDSSHRISKHSEPPKIPNLPPADLLLRKSPTHVLNRPCPVSIVRGCELESSHNLDLLLKEREKELQRRREHVEHLLEWHQRLDKEEAEVLRIEQMLYEYNQQKQQQNRPALPPSIKLIETAERKKQKRITEIDKSLRELQSITSCSESNTSVPQPFDTETVRISGRKMNRLWYRLTGRTTDKRFDQAKYYKLNKIDLEKFYEDAKMAVVQEFEENILLKILADQSSKTNNISGSSLSSSNSGKRPKNNKYLHDIEVPNLNLNFSSGPSESEIVETKQSMIGDTSTNNSEQDAKIIRESLTVNTKSSENNETIEIQAALSGINTTATESNSSSPTEREATVEVISSRQSQSDSILSSNSPTSNFLPSPLEEDSISLQLKVASEEEMPKSVSGMAENNLEKIPQVVQTGSSETNSGSTSKVRSFESLESNEVATQTRNSSYQTLSTSPKRSDPENDLSPNYTTPSSNSISNVIPTETDTMNHKTETNGDQTTPPTLTSNSSSYKTETYIPLTVSFDNNESNNESASELSPPEILLNSDSLNLPNITVISPCHNNSIEDVEDETMLEDISEPKFETTGDISKSLDEELVSEHIVSGETEETSKMNGDESSKNQSSSDLEKRLIDLDESLKNLHQSFDRALSPSPSPSPSNSLTNFTDLPEIVDEDKENRPHDATGMKLTVKDYLLNPEATTGLMPDIINEVELRRRQQILVESDIIQLENAVPYALLREIPNKPPPPYVPPAHGSPMTTIFPSEARIKEITFRRTKELYDEINAKENNREYQPSSPSILHENITNIYERMILDICKECIRDYQPTFTSNSVMVGNYKMPLALYNPPNRLKCIQEFVYKRVRKLLAMDKPQPRQNSILSIGRRKRDHVDEILVQELFEEEQKWTNFDLEESEVRAAVVDEIFSELVSEVVGDFEEAYKKKLQLKQNHEPQSDATGSDSAVEK